jgi:hypothetical protein
MRIFTVRTVAIVGLASAVFAALALGAGAFAQPVRNDGSVQLSFTKWVTISPGGSRMEGIVHGAAAPNPSNAVNFAGQVLDFQPTNIFGVLSAATGDINLLQAVYEVNAGEHSLRALIHGGNDNVSNKAFLDGRVLGGWLAGNSVHVEFTTVQCTQPNAANGQCFTGTITIAR